MNPWRITAKILKWVGIVGAALLVLGCMAYVPYTFFVMPEPPAATWLTVPPIVFGTIIWGSLAFFTLWNLGEVFEFLVDVWDEISSWWKGKERAWDKRKEEKAPEDDPPPYEWDPETLGDLPHAYTVEDYRAIREDWAALEEDWEAAWRW